MSNSAMTEVRLHGVSEPLKDAFVSFLYARAHEECDLDIEIDLAMYREVMQEYQVVFVETADPRWCGVCFYDEKLIAINKKLPATLIQEILVHEVCHALAREVFHEPGHGREWAELVMRAGYPAKTHYCGIHELESVA